MKELVIDLTFRRTDFEELYFRNGNEKLFFAPLIKKNTYAFLIIGLLLIISYCTCFFLNKTQEITQLIMVLFILVGVNFFEKINEILKWRKSIKKYLDSVEEFNSYKLILNEQALTLIQDQQESIEKWSAIKSALIYPDSIRLYSEVDYLFPRKSMLDEEFELLQKMIKEKVKDSQV